MPTIVSKFGGSSTANADCFLRILHILRASSDRRYVVLSAPGTDAQHRAKVTSMLEKVWRLRADDLTCAAMCHAIARRYGEIADAFGIDGFEAHAMKTLETAVSDSRAHVLSRGEFLCAELVAHASGMPFVDAKEVVRFDACGTLDPEGTLIRLKAMSATHECAVIPGFYGADGSGRLRVFPRNGSDISGALAAAGVSAALYENWTDVPGLMTADPAIVPNARLIGQISYRQMRAFARAGAQVLHPACLDPVAMAGIPTRLRCTMRPECFGTLIDEHVTRDAPCVAARRIPKASDGQEDSEGEAVVNVFGIDAARILQAAKPLHPLRFEVAKECVRLFVQPHAMEDAVRELHRQLIESNG